MHSNIPVVRRLLEAVERRDFESMLDCYAPDVEINESDDLPYGGTYRGYEGVREHAEGFMRTWGRFQTEARDAKLDARFTEGTDGLVTAIFRHRANDPERREQLQGDEVGVYEVRDGKVVRSQMFHFEQGTLARFLREATT